MSVAEYRRCRTLAVRLGVGLLAAAAARPGSSRLGPAPPTQSGRSFSALTWRWSTGRQWAAYQGRDDLPGKRKKNKDLHTLELRWSQESETFKGTQD